MLLRSAKPEYPHLESSFYENAGETQWMIYTVHDQSAILRHS